MECKTSTPRFALNQKSDCVYSVYRGGIPYTIYDLERARAWPAKNDFEIVGCKSSGGPRERWCSSVVQWLCRPL